MCASVCNTISVFILHWTVNTKSKKRNTAEARTGGLLYKNYNNIQFFVDDFAIDLFAIFFPL